MKTTFSFLHSFALGAAVLAVASALGCSTAAPKKYVFFGEPQPQSVETFEDFWADDPSVFKPDDSNLPLRRGKAGVIRFFKKDSYSKSILVDGTLTVNVYDGVGDGITMTQPDAQLVVSSKDLNEKYRDYNKKVGYTYHIWLDLGEYDQPEKEITILSVFKDEKSGQTTLSKPIQTVATGTTPLPTADEKKKLSEAERWARKKLGDKASDDPIGDLQRRYSTRNAKQEEEEEKNSKTRVRESIDVSAARLRTPDDAKTDVAASNVQGVSFLQQFQDARDARLAQYLEERREQQTKRRAELDEYLAETPSRFDRTNPLNEKNGAMGALNFQNARPDYQTTTENFAAQMKTLASAPSTRADEEYQNGPGTAEPNGTEPLTLGYDANALAEAQNRSRAAQSTVCTSPGVVFANESNALQPATTNPHVAAALPSDGFDDFQPDANSPQTEVYVGRVPTPY